jgi:hypothetical protein
MNQDKLATLSDESLDQVAGGGLIGSVVGATAEAAGTIAGALVTAGGKVVTAVNDFLKPLIRWIF